MNAKKLLAILLSMTLLLGALAACGETLETAPEASPEVTAEPAPTQEPAAEPIEETEEADARTQAILDALAAARESHDPDEVVCTVDGQDVTWDLYYYLLSDELLTVIYYMGGLPEDYGEALTEDMTLQDYLLETAEAKAKYYTIAHTEAVERALGLTEEQEQEIEEYIGELVESYGGEEALIAAMAEANLTPDLFRTILRSNEELTALMEFLYGANGEKLSEAEVLDWAAQQGYIRVKHILYYFQNEDGSEMNDEEKAALRERAEATLAELRAIESNAELANAFHERMNADSGDLGGLISFQDGYTFTSGTMYPVFEEAAFALEEYALSDIVESDSGYHLILRLPLDTECVTMDQDANTGEYMTLRQSAANDLFSRALAGWMEEAEITWNEVFKNLDLNALFAAE